MTPRHFRRTPCLTHLRPDPRRETRVETPKNDAPKTLTAQPIDGGSSLLPMLVVGLVMVTVGYAVLMVFV